MAERVFDPETRAKILRNKNVLRVGEKQITYSPDFKVEAVRANLVEGKPPYLIFFEAGFDLDLIGHETPKDRIKRWRAIYSRRGEEGLRHDERGRHSTGRPAGGEVTVEEELRRARAQIRYLKKENELLKKLDALERSVVNRPAEKYVLIHDVVFANESFTVSYLCEVAGVSRSGYYRWLHTASCRLQREAADYEQHLVIRDIFVKLNRKAGWRVIRMHLERRHITMNPKKIRRLMKKYDLITQIRRRNPYRQMAKATQEHRTAPNVLERRFNQAIPYRTFGTDITYLYDGNGQRLYLSTLLDLATGEIVAHRVAASLGIDLSLAVIAQATARLGHKQLRGVMIHSDQGFHYTHPHYIRYLADRGIVQSMSRKGNCLDNAPVESFFGHMKDEIDLSCCCGVNQVKRAVAGYIRHYNHHRYQWGRKKMAPVEYRNHLLAS